MWLPSIAGINAPAWLKGQSKRLRTAVLVFSALFIADLLLYALAVAPSAAQLASTESQYRDLRKRHTEAVLFAKQKADFAGIVAGIPAQKDMPLLVKDLVQTAKGLRLGVSSVKYDIPKRAGEELALLSFSFPAEGRYPDIKRFVFEVETSDRLVGIQNLKMDGDKGSVKLEMKLVTYVKGL